MTEPTEKIDWTDKHFPIPFDAPITVAIDPGSGSLWVQSTQLVPGVTGGAAMRAVFSPAAARQLAQILKRIEDELGTPIEDLAKPNSVQ